MYKTQQDKAMSLQPTTTATSSAQLTSPTPHDLGY